MRRLFVVNQVVGPLARELLEDLSRLGISSTVLAGWVDAEPGEGLPFRVLRGRVLTKAPAWKRLWSWLLFSAQAVGHAIRRRSEPFLVVTNPPPAMLAFPLLRRLTGLRYVLLVYDIYPDIGERMGVLRPGGLVARFWRRLSRRALLRAEGVITLGSHMAASLRGHLRPGDACAIEVIPNWADTDAIRPLAKPDNPFAREHGLVDKFVVMYSGSLGATHDIESIIEAADRLRDLADVHFVLIGGGTREQEVRDLVARRNLSNLTLLPLQPLSVLPRSLACADCMMVCLDEGYEGLAVPSKTYPALAAGSALLAISPPDTELTDLVRECGCGIPVLPRRPEALAEAVRRLHADREELSRMKEAARRAAVDRFSRRAATDRYAVYLAGCFAD